MMKIPKTPAVIARTKRYAIVRDPGGSAEHFGSLAVSTNLSAVLIRDGKPIKEFDFGSGKLTEAFVLALAKDLLGTSVNKGAPILSSLKYMYTGTGTTTEQAYDYGLQTPINSASSAITPALSVVNGTNNVAIQWVGTVAYSGSYAVTEWGLFNANVSGSQYNTSTVNYSGTTITPGSITAAANAYAGYVAICGTSSGTPNQTGASYYGAFIESNVLNGALTIAQPSNDGISYWTINNNGGAGSVPSTNTRFDIWPLMADHKTFLPINVGPSDSVQFTYSLTLQSGS